MQQMFGGNKLITSMNKDNKAPKEPKAAKEPKASKEAKVPKIAKEPKADKEPKTDKEPKVEQETKVVKISRLREKYKTDIIPALKKAMSYKNVMQVPRLEKVVLNVGLGEAIQNIKLLDAARQELEMITGQKAVITKAKKSIATFKLREGMPIGCKVTLRGEKMYEFIDRFISLTLPSIRDFRGVSTKSFDGRGNYSIGIKEQYIFPEIDYDKVDMVHGLDVIICTTAKTDNEARELLRHLGMPFAK